MSGEIDLIVVEDQRRAEQIIDALRQGGIDHVDCRSDRHSFRGGGPFGSTPYWATVFHICVREEDFAQAQHVLKASGLASDRPTAKSTATQPFGVGLGSHLAHFHARHENGCIELDWEAPYGDKLRWRVLRSESGFAADAEPPGANGQVLVAESTQTHLVDPGLDPEKHFSYTVFSQEPDGTWRKQVEVKLRAHDLFGFFHPHRQDAQDPQASPATSPAPSQLQQTSLQAGGDPFAPVPAPPAVEQPLSASIERPDSTPATGEPWPAAAPPDERPQPGGVSAPSAPTAPSPPESID